MFTVHVRVTDSDNGKPVPARLRLVAAGREVAPLGRMPHAADPGGCVLLEGEAYHIDGGCEARLPPGPVRAWVSRGPEHRADRRDLQFAHGQMAIRLTLQRVFDWRQRGWYSGDCRSHTLSPHAALLEGRGEGLAVVQLLIRQQPGEQAPNLLAFSGTEASLTHPDCVVVVNTLNEHPYLGSVSLLNSHRPVFPLRAGAPEEEWSVRDWCGQCHRKKGLVVWPALPRLSAENPQSEALACLLLGEIDAYEVGPDVHLNSPEMTWYYRLLDCGARATLVAGTGKDSTRLALGTVRTYARCPAGFTLSAWTDSVRAGQTFITNGPLLDFTYSDGRARVEVESLVQFERLEIVAGGEVVASTTGKELDTIVVPEETTWLAARCVGPGAFAHTSAVWVDVPGKPWRVRPESREQVRDLLNQTTRWGQRLSDKGRAALEETVTAAMNKLETRPTPNR